MKADPDFDTTDKRHPEPSRMRAGACELKSGSGFEKNKTREEKKPVLRSGALLCMKGKVSRRGGVNFWEGDLYPSGRSQARRQLAQGGAGSRSPSKQRRRAGRGLLMHSPTTLLASNVVYHVPVFLLRFEATRIARLRCVCHSRGGCGKKSARLSPQLGLHVKLKENFS